jgi:hypothetical protein
MAQPTAVGQTRSLAALLTDPSRDGPLPVLVTADLKAPPATPKIQVLAEVMAAAWAVKGTADPGHTISGSNPLGSVTSIGTASGMHFESRSRMDSAGHRRSRGLGRTTDSVGAC